MSSIEVDKKTAYKNWSNQLTACPEARQMMMAGPEGNGAGKHADELQGASRRNLNFLAGIVFPYWPMALQVILP